MKKVIVEKYKQFDRQGSLTMAIVDDDPTKSILERSSISLRQFSAMDFRVPSSFLGNIGESLVYGEPDGPDECEEEEVELADQRDLHVSATVDFSP